MDQKTKTYIGISRDHSASMRSLTASAKQDYNKTITEIRQTAYEEGDDTIVSVVKCGVGWRATVDTEVVNSSVNAIGELSNYVADGHATPLYDSVGKLITLFKATPDYTDPKVSFVVMVITDGEENSSVEWSKAKLAAEIKQLQATDRWTFIFRVPRGGKQRIARDLNLYDGNIIEWSQTTQGYEQSTQATTVGFKNFYVAKKAGVTATRSFYATDLTEVDLTTIKANLIDVSSQVTIWDVDVPHGNSQIRDFCEIKSGEKMKKGAAFYRLDKREDVQDHKQIAIRDSKGAVYIGPAARDLMKLPHTGTIRLAPGDQGDYTVFVQSTSVNRKLPEGTQVLYWPNIGQPYKEGKSA